MNKPILVTEPMPIVMQTEHEKVVEKVLRDHQQRAACQLESKLFQLKKDFARDFINMSEIVMGLSTHKRDSFYEAVKNFCECFSSVEERLALEKAIRQHPKYKMHIAFFVTMLVLFVSSFAMLGAGGGPVMVAFIPIPLIMLQSILSSTENTAIVETNFLLEPFLPPVVRYFFSRRKLIRLGGPKAPEEVIKEMRPEYL